MDCLDWNFLLSIIPLRSFQVVMCIFIPFLLLRIFHGMDVLYHFCFVSEPVTEEHLGWFTFEGCKAATID